MVLNKAVAVGSSIFSRAVFFLSLASYVYASNSDHDVVVFFQLLFLQAIVIAFLSASGFFRAQNFTTADQASAFFSVYLVLGVSSLLALLGFLFFSEQYSAYKIPVILIWGGAVFTAFSSPLSGYLIISQGPIKTFLPSIVVAIICTLIVGFSPYEMIGLQPYLLIVGYQAVTFLVLAVLAKDVVASAIVIVKNLKVSEYLGHVKENLNIGVILTIHLAIIFQFRETWSSSVAPSVASAVFLVFRFSDTLMQFTHMVLSRHAVVSKVYFAGNSSRIALVLVWAGICSFGLYYTAQYSAAFAPLMFAITAQIILDIFRQVWGLAFLSQMENFKLMNYYWYVIFPPIFSYIVTYLTVGNQTIVAIYTFNLIIVATGALITLLQLRRGSPL